MPVIFFILWRSMWKNIILKILLRSHKYFSRYLGKTQFHTWTVFESSRFGARWTVTSRGQRRYMRKKKSYETCSFSCIVLSVYEQLFLYFYFLFNPGWPNKMLFEFKLVFYRTKMPNSENCLIDELSQICNPLSI